MLAYVFWHWPKPSIEIDEYIRKLIEFHASLASHAPDGFSHSVVVELTRPPWLQAESVAFEDWYLVRDSAVLDQLNFAAVSGENELPHNQVALCLGNRFKCSLCQGSNRRKKCGPVFSGPQKSGRERTTIGEISQAYFRGSTTFLSPAM